MDQQAVTDPGEQRDSDRTAMFVSAVLCEDKATHQIRIRNMSPNGALIEGPSLAPPGTPVALVRADLSATGHVAWVHGGRSGIALDNDVDVPAWMSLKAHPRQQEVDRLVREVRAQLRSVPEPVAPAPEPSYPAAVSAVAPIQGASDELLLVAALLQRLEESLIDDPGVLARHGVALQAIDEAQQRLNALSARLRG